MTSERRTTWPDVFSIPIVWICIAIAAWGIGEGIGKIGSSGVTVHAPQAKSIECREKP